MTPELQQQRHQHCQQSLTEQQEEQQYHPDAADPFAELIYHLSNYQSNVDHFHHNNDNDNNDYRESFSSMDLGGPTAAAQPHHPHSFHHHHPQSHHHHHHDNGMDSDTSSSPSPPPSSVPTTTTTADAKSDDRNEAEASAAPKWTLPSDILQQYGRASEHSIGLSHVPVMTLHHCLQPILDSLKQIDAEALLCLQRCPPNAFEAAKLQPGVFVRPVHNAISPPCDPHTVRYLHLSELPDQYSMGIFIFPPFARIPLHDHPGMCVLSRVLYGTLQRLSLDLARDQPQQQQDTETTAGATELPVSSSSTTTTTSTAADASQSKTLIHTITHDTQSNEQQQQLQQQADSKSFRRKSTGTIPPVANSCNSQSVSTTCNSNNNNSNTSPNSSSLSPLSNSLSNSLLLLNKDLLPCHTVPGTKLAYQTKPIDDLQAPECAILFPFEGNLHEFVAGPSGAAVLDVLLPPYDVTEQPPRDCTFYEVRDCTQKQKTLIAAFHHHQSQQQQQQRQSQQHQQQQQQHTIPLDHHHAHLMGPRTPCWIVPTGQPEDFHCISGTYEGLGCSPSNNESGAAVEESMDTIHHHEE